MKTSLFSLIYFVSQVQSHGFLYSPTPRSKHSYTAINDLEYAHDIQFNIDELRNPIDRTNLCRNIQPDGTRTSINLASGKPFTVQLALSIGAEHIGSCSLELYKNDMSKMVVLAKDVDGCTTEKVHAKTQISSVLCPNSTPKGLVTNDMCYYPWTVTLPSLEGVDFTTGFLRWSWTSKHAVPFEFYANCADVDISIDGNVAKTPTKSNTLKATSITLPGAALVGVSNLKSKVQVTAHKATTVVSETKLETKSIKTIPTIGAKPRKTKTAHVPKKTKISKPKETKVITPKRNKERKTKTVLPKASATRKARRTNN